jgi:hypothetical protein
MNSSKNSFELAPLQDHMRTLRAAGYVIYTTHFPGLPEDDPAAYAALVMPQVEHEAKLREQSSLAASGELPEAIIQGDPRFVCAASAWQALADSEEAVARLADNAPPASYYRLTNHPATLGRFEQSADLL